VGGRVWCLSDLYVCVCGVWVGVSDMCICVGCE